MRRSNWKTGKSGKSLGMTGIFYDFVKIFFNCKNKSVSVKREQAEKPAFSKNWNFIHLTKRKISERAIIFCVKSFYSFSCNVNLYFSLKKFWCPQKTTSRSGKKLIWVKEFGEKQMLHSPLKNVVKQLKILVPE